MVYVLSIFSLTVGSLQLTLYSFLPISCGVPQGSVLGPILFIIYTSDVFSIINSFSLLSHGYADDLQIYGHSPAESVSLLSASVVSCIDALNSWFSSNRLKLNPSKTEFILLDSPRRLPPKFPSVLLGGCTVVPTSVVRDLGFYLDS